MLQLKSITKNYKIGDTTQTALKGVSVNFRENEFVSILGQSGSGKTTLLNIIGGLDRYSDGDLIINGTSTKEYSDSDWDSYRNNSIGFIFQSYNLIPHQSILANVELALTLSGVSKAERNGRFASKHKNIMKDFSEELKKAQTEFEATGDYKAWDKKYSELTDKKDEAIAKAKEEVFGSRYENIYL